MNIHVLKQNPLFLLASKPFYKFLVHMLCLIFLLDYLLKFHLVLFLYVLLCLFLMFHIYPPSLYLCLMKQSIISLFSLWFIQFILVKKFLSNLSDNDVLYFVPKVLFYMFLTLIYLAFISTCVRGRA